MKTVLVQNLLELAPHRENIARFLRSAGAKYTTHLPDPLLEWFDSFSSDGDRSFGEKRGRNFFGRRSELRSLFFLLVYDSDRLSAFAPMFRFQVNFARSAPDQEVIAFCPDSTIFFYNDVAALPGCESCASRALARFFREYRRGERYIVLFNHVPSTSRMLPLLTEAAMPLAADGFQIGTSPLFRRGGVYPWNLRAIEKLLAQGAEDPQLPESTRTRIRESLGKVTASSRTMLAFPGNHPPVKAAVYRVFSEAAERLFPLYGAAERVFSSTPVKYPYLSLPASAEEFESSLTSSRRYYYQRYVRKFLSCGGSFQKMNGGTVGSGDIGDFIDLHRERWGKESNILNGSTEHFLCTFLEKLADQRLLTLFFALHEGKRISSVCCIDLNGRREFFSSGRTLSAERLRAGKLVLYRCVLDAAASGFLRFDFAYGDEEYKSDYHCSFLTNNVLSLFRGMRPDEVPNLFPSYEEVRL